jgi:hypothetical protein
MPHHRKSPEMRNQFGIRWAGLLLLSAACATSTGPEAPLLYQFHLNSEQLADWTSGSSDYLSSQEAAMEVVIDKRALPGSSGSAFYHAGTNLSDDLWIWFARRMEGFEPGRRHRIGFEIGYVTSYHADCIGTGELVIIKAGASEEQPARVLTGDGSWRMNVDKGEQFQEGADAVILGDIRNDLPGCPAEPQFGAGTADAGDGMVEVTADANGGFWVFFGTESAFETRHEIYFTRFFLFVTPLDQ